MSAFITLPVTLPISAKDGDAAVHHYLFYKEHTAKRTSEELPQKKTLFVLNPPLDAEAGLAAVFSAAGEVVSVVRTTMQGHRAGGSGGAGAGSASIPIAYVVFKKAASLQKALHFDPTEERMLPQRPAEAFGLQRWREEYEAARPDAAELQARIDADLAAFDDEKARDKALRMAMDGKEDEEGWTVVVKGGKMVAEDAAGTGQVNVDQNPKKRAKKDRELQNFYRFQQKDARKDQIASLRKKFDLDKMRISQMKGDRKFRPY